MDRLLRSARIASLLLLVYWLLLFLGTHTPVTVPSEEPHADKVMHFGAYAGLTFLVAWAVRTRRPHAWRSYRLVLGLVAVYGVVDELLQIPLASRTGDVWDWVADMSGAVVGLGAFLAAQGALGWVWRQSLRRFEEPRAAVDPDLG